jgi:prepilin-type N-terminal cleavage/methylation domain-containing protein
MVAMRQLIRRFGLRTSNFEVESGFSLPELLVSVALMLIIYGAVCNGLAKLSNAHRTIWNRTEMHSGVRGATELMQQEIGQAGRVSLPGNPTLAAATNAIAVPPVAQTLAVTSAAGMFVGEQLVFDGGDNRETVTLTAVNVGTNQITGVFTLPHVNGSAIAALGGFSSGVVPTYMVNGSSASVLKLYGDLNSDGNMVYAEYTCDTAAHNLYRNVMPWNATSKPALGNAQVLLTNIVANPGGAACFTYQSFVVGANTYVTDVAITLTVQTQSVDPVTKQFQLETKALLNVSPRNVFNVWELASIGLTNRVQPMPPSILALLP